MKKISIKNIYLILVISIGLIVLGIGSTYAMFTSSSNIDNPISLSSNLTYSSDIFESFDITLSSKESKTIKLNINNNTNISSINYASWYIYEGSDTDLTFYTIIDNSTDIEPSGTLSTSGSINIKIVNNTTNKVSLTVGLSSNKDNIVLPDYMKLITVNKEKTFADYITNLYTSASKTTVTNNSITYNYATSESLMNDRLGGTTDLDGGNIRYYGANPNNYIYFNCSDYSNQTSDTCELWRIIGIFDGMIKIMRNSIIGSYSWDTSDSAVNSGYGVNEWSQADLMKLLNPGYETESVGGSLYYNSGSGTCYSGRSNTTKSCDFTSTGLKNDTTRKMIEEVTYYTGGWNSSSIYSNQIYSYERGTTVISSPGDKVTRATEWPSKIAVPYPSDYGYATDFNKCSQTLLNYDSSTDSYACRSNDWMYPIITNSGSNYGWLLTPASDYESSAFRMNSDGLVRNSNLSYDVLGVAPVLYLSSDVLIEEGNTGVESDPYRLLND